MAKISNSETTLALLAILACGVFLASGCIQMPQQTGPQAGPSSSRTSCDAGSWIKTAGFEYRITGVETYTIAGRTVETCCTEKIIEGKKSKVCVDMDSGDYSIVWLTDESTGELYKAGEVYPQGDKTCQIMYGPNGEKISEMCI